MPNILQELTWNDGIEESVKYHVKNVFTKEGTHIYKGRRIFELTNEAEKRSVPIKAKFGGVVTKVLTKVGDEVSLGSTLIEIKSCTHPTVLGNICCDCGVVFEPSREQSEKDKTQDLVSMLHSVPDLKVSKEEAKRVGNEDIKHLLDKRKLVLLVDLDQTLIHTTNDNIPPKLKDVFHFQLVQNGLWYHTRLRPFTSRFLHNVSKLYELHICTFGVREYAHCIAHFLDPDRQLFGDRILSRNECLDPMSKKANLSSLFPCGDNLVCIIDDRSDVWNFAPNVVQVMPYHFFQHTGDINAPPGLQKKDNDTTRTGFDFSNLDLSSSSAKANKSSNDKDRSSDSGEDSLHESEESKSEKETQPKNETDVKSSSAEIKETEVKASSAEVKETKETEVKASSPELKETKEISKVESEEKREKRIPKVPRLDGDGYSPPASSGEESESGKTVEQEDQPEEGGRLKVVLPDEKSSSSSSSETTMKEDSPTAVETREFNESDTVDVEDSDDYLLYLEDILKKLHSRFYELYEPDSLKNKGDNIHSGDNNVHSSLPDLKKIVPTIRRKVLTGVHLVFSSIVPTSVNLRDSKAFHIATSLGATVSERIVARGKKDSSSSTSDDGSICPTTHVVAANLHTEKVHEAKKLKNIKIVTPNWLWCCAERWEHVDERIFKFTRDSERTIVRNPPMHCLVNLKEPPPTYSIQLPHPPATIETHEDHALFDSLNPLAFLSNDETKSMEEEVDDLLSEEEDNQKQSTNKDVDADSEGSSESSDEDSALESSPKASSSEEDRDRRKRKRQRTMDDDDDDDEVEDEEEEEELPSIRFRQGGALPSDESDLDSADEDMNAYGDILERELLRE